MSVSARAQVAQAAQERMAIGSPQYRSAHLQPLPHRSGSQGAQGEGAGMTIKPTSGPARTSPDAQPIPGSPGTGAAAGSPTALEKFALACLAESRVDFGDLDGGWIQDAAEALGLLVRVQVTEPCGENCNCAECGDFPMDCLRYAPDVLAMIEEKP